MSGRVIDYVVVTVTYGSDFPDANNFRRITTNAFAGRTNYYFGTRGYGWDSHPIEFTPSDHPASAKFQCNYFTMHCDFDHAKEATLGALKDFGYQDEWKKYQYTVAVAPGTGSPRI